MKIKTERKKREREKEIIKERRIYLGGKEDKLKKQKK